jgi:adenine deaminase
MLEQMIDQGAGREPADIVLKGGRFFDLVTGELVESDIAISGDRIVGTFALLCRVLSIRISILNRPM